MLFVKMFVKWARGPVGVAMGALCLFPVYADTGGDTAAAERQKMKQLGLEHESAWELYAALKKKAGGGKQMISPDEIPDWRGVYTRRGGTTFDPDGPPQGELPSANFTPEYHKKVVRDVKNRREGIEYDPLSQCEPPGFPRWHSMPFLREFIVTPYQTTMVAEAFNSVRRVYTDGRGHIPEADRYPTENGDTIGFWDGDKLVAHTNQLMSGMYERAQGFYSEQVETVEVWEKVEDRLLVAHLWIYDPPALEEPWYTRQQYVKLKNPDKGLRVRHWACRGNQNNDVVETEEGGSTFRNLTFTDDDDDQTEEAR